MPRLTSSRRAFLGRSLSVSAGALLIAGTKASGDFRGSNEDIRVAVAGTEGYEEFLRRKLYKLEGLRHSRSTFVLRCLKRSHSVEP